MKQGLIKRFTGDLLYGVVSLVIMNVVLSFGIYPYLSRSLGDEQYGRMHFYVAIMGLMASAIGSGINYGRMKASTKHETKNGDYNCFLLVLAVLSCVVTLVCFAIKKDAANATVWGIMILIFATSVRYYADVEYRLYMNYRGFFFYYLIIAVGYIVGWLLYPVTGSWVGILLCGEISGLFFVGFTGHIFKGKPFEASPYRKEDALTCTSLSATYLLSDFVSYADRITLSLMVSDAAAGYFYIASLVGKTASLLSTPLNGVITGHLSHYSGKITKKMYGTMVAILAGLTVLLIAASVIGSYILIGILYQEQYQEVKSLFLAANAGQVLFFMSNTMMVIVLRIASERYQLGIGIVYILSFIVIVLPLVWRFGLWGLAGGLLGINALKFIMVAVLGLWALRKEA